MAALATGVQYGLSSRSSNDNISLFFVKFTDSSYRALEEFAKNVDRKNQSPTIQFDFPRNKGHLSIPTQSASSSRYEKYSFNISPSSEEGNIVECLQSTGSRALESLGKFKQTINIQAKEDSYEMTKQKMTVVDEQQKKNRTKVIKPTVADIGRTVKVIPGSSTLSATNHSSNILSRSISNSMSRGPMHNPSSQQHSRVASNNHAQKPGNPDIMRRPLKERLIHVLALRPYKKPELYERFHREGLFEKDKKSLNRMVCDVANMRKDNTYDLIRSYWNDVQDDWPFYTEQERQILKRRKPQNLTPPGSSDTGSSGSGQSPTSTHPGSPPSVIQNPLKRSSESIDVIPAKKRISHFQRQANESSYRPITDSIMSNYHQDLEEDSQSTRLNRFYPGDNFAMDDRRNKRIGNSTNNVCKDRFKEKERMERTYGVTNNKNFSSDSIKKSNNFTSDVISNKRPNNFSINNETDSSDKRFNSNSSEKIYEKKLEEKIKRSDSPATVTSSQPQNGPKYDVNYADTRPSYEATDDKIQENTVSASSEFPDYVTEYTTITSNEQKRKYKEDFASNYEEYKRLHAKVEDVSLKFAELEVKLRNTPRNTREYEIIRDEIRRRYKQTKDDRSYEEAKKRFNYLHSKLKHIKDLVAEYDRITYD